MIDHTKNKKPATTEPQNNSESQKNSEIQRLQEKCKEYLRGWQRVKADYINREREIERQRSEWIEFSNLEFILRLLPIYENLNQSLNHQSDNKDFVKGIEQIKKQFDEFLKSLGVEKIKTVGEKFNPDFHEAVEKQGDNSEIVEEVSPGYKINRKVIKVAKVIIK